MIDMASTRTLDAQDKIDFWNDLIGSTYPGMVVDPLAAGFDARLSVWEFADVRMVRPVSTSAKITRHARSQGNPLPPKYIVHTLVRGEARLDQRGRRATLQEGDMVICASDEFYQFDAFSSHEMLVAEVETQELSNRLPNIDDFVARTISGKLPGTRLLRRFMDSLWQEAREPMQDQHWHMHADVLVDLVVASLEASRGDASVSVDPLLKSVQDLIDERLGDFDLGPASISRDLGVPLRTLQAVAARGGTTIGRMIVQHRLRKAATLLVAQQPRSVTDIAVECGFADPSYFARRFQEAFGTSPRKYRRFN